MKFSRYGSRIKSIKIDFSTCRPSICLYSDQCIPTKSLDLNKLIMKTTIRTKTTASIAACGIAMLPMFATVHANVDAPAAEAADTIANTATVFIVKVIGKG